MPVLNLIAMNPFSSLNPYYTGIHLHSFSNAKRIKCLCVLILIILEYIYIQQHIVEKFVAYCVLILIILEYIYIVKNS